MAKKYRSFDPHFVKKFYFLFSIVLETYKAIRHSADGTNI